MALSKDGLNVPFFFNRKEAKDHGEGGAGHAGIGQKFLAGVDEGTPAHHAAKGQSPDVHGAGFDVWAGEMLLAMGILLLFGVLNILGVEKAGIVQTILATLLGVSVLALTVAALISSKATVSNMAPWWGFDKARALAAAAEHNDEGVVRQLAAMIPTFTPTRQNLKL